MPTAGLNLSQPQSTANKRCGRTWSSSCWDDSVSVGLRPVIAQPVPKRQCNASYFLLMRWDELILWWNENQKYGVLMQGDDPKSVLQGFSYISLRIKKNLMCCGCHFICWLKAIHRFSFGHLKSLLHVKAFVLPVLSCGPTDLECYVFDRYQLIISIK